MFARPVRWEPAEKVSAEHKDDELHPLGAAASSFFVMPGPWHGEIGLAGDPTSAREARAFVRRAMGDEVSGGALQDVLLVASEMVSNVIRHAQTPLTLSLELHPTYVRLTVTDGLPPFETVAETAADAESGRGMGIIGSVSRRWGVGDTPIGKSIWAEIPLT
jgi:hypothetical protein